MRAVCVDMHGMIDSVKHLWRHCRTHPPLGCPAVWATAPTRASDHPRPRSAGSAHVAPAWGAGLHFKPSGCDGFLDVLAHGL